MNKAELQTILEQHKLWLSTDGASGARADLSGADLSGANLSGANLSRADLSGADLYGADLSQANLSYAYLSHANLSGADLTGASLSGADLYGADLSYTNLSKADLSYAILSGANLSHTCITSFSLGKHNGYAWRKGKKIIVMIGCIEHEINDFLKNINKIGKENDYNKDEIKAYKLQLQLIKKLMRGK